MIIFQKMVLPSALFDTEVNALNPLQVGHSGIIYSPTLNQVLVGKGMIF
jgi:hypothetical protein